MKISNETKVGALTAIAVAFLIMGFNFLKGKNLLKSGNYIYANYTNTKKLVPSSPVYINGFQVGTVNDIESNLDVQHVTISIKLNDKYNIPKNSMAFIESSLLGSPNIIILPGNATTYLNNNDTIQTTEKGDLMSQVSDKIGPVTDKLTATLATLDTVLQNINSLMDPNTKGNLKSVIDNLSLASASVVVSVNSLQQMLDKQNGALAQSLNNMNLFTKNLVLNNGKIDSIMGNLKSTTDHLAAADVDG
ncbi:MAG: MlaD family protein, partial [Chitinophagaceae bacterium]